MASRGITVKLPKDKVIKSLQERLKEYDNIKENYPKLKEAQAKKEEAYKKAVYAAARKALSKATNYTISTRNYGSNGTQVTFSYDPDLLPKEPVSESIEDPSGYHFRERYEELQQAIRLLTMSEDEYVSTSTYKSITRFL